MVKFLAINGGVALRTASSGDKLALAGDKLALGKSEEWR